MTRTPSNQFVARSYPATSSDTAVESMTVEIWRGTEKGRFERYQVPRWRNQTVLDVVSHVQRHLEPSLAYRYACRVGVCGSCTMTVNGTARWTCRTHVEQVDRGKRLRIEPLRNFPVVKDLVCDISEFFDKLSQAGGWFHPTRTRLDELALVSPRSAERQVIDAAIECIGCGACYASCAVEAMNPDYLGPAALNRVWTLLNDIRDGAGEQRLARVSGYDGCNSCKTLMSCTELCPKHIPLTESIAGLKRATAARAASRRGRRRPGNGNSADQDKSANDEAGRGHDRTPGTTLRNERDPGEREEGDSGENGTASHQNPAK